MEKVKVETGIPYTVWVGDGILDRIPEMVKKSMGEKTWDSIALIVTDKNIARLYMKPLALSLKKHGFSVKHAVFPPGEKLKSQRYLLKLLREMVRYSLTRDSLVIALGGGVIGDFAGFGSSIYMRGCHLVQVPTTLLAQVDSSIGGKVGINLREGKNLVGSFYNPLMVITDISTLKSLNERELAAGFAEIIKYGLIFKRELFERIERFFTGKGEISFSAGELKQRVLSHMDFLGSIILESVKIKAEIVKADERENDLRMILNFGHTFGHAIEKVTRYHRFLHGEAVFLGMRMAVELSRAAGMLDTASAGRILNLLHGFRVPPVKGVSARSVYQQIGRDKKKRKGMLHYILLKEIGYALSETGIEKGTIMESIAKTLALNR